MRCSFHETTRIDHYTYRFAKKAESEGMVVIDDPDSSRRVPRPNTPIVSRENVKDIGDVLGFPLVLKIPDGSFSRGVSKAANTAELKKLSAQYFRDSYLILAQEYMYTEFDWRVGILNRQPLFVCQYFMSKKDWQVVNHNTRCAPQSGGFKTLSVEEAPPKVIKTALRAADLVGDGLYAWISSRSATEWW